MIMMQQLLNIQLISKINKKLAGQLLVGLTIKFNSENKYLEGKVFKPNKYHGDTLRCEDMIFTYNVSTKLCGLSFMMTNEMLTHPMQEKGIGFPLTNINGIVDKTCSRLIMIFEINDRLTALKTMEILQHMLKY